MEMSFRLQRSDQYYYTDKILVKTSIADSYQQNLNDFGQEVVNENGIRLVCQEFMSSEGRQTSDVLFYIENNTDEDIQITTEDENIMVNDSIEIAPYSYNFFSTMHAHSKAYTRFIVSSSVAKQVKNLTVKFIATNEDHKVVLHTKKLKISDDASKNEDGMYS